jgi:CDP-glucose 4,6-dehydratase
LTGEAALQANFGLNDLCSAFNFGPQLDSNRPVGALVEEVLKTWPGEWADQSDPPAPHEASLLNLTTDKAHHVLGWAPRWGFQVTVEATITWYKEMETNQADPLRLTQDQFNLYCADRH